LTGDPSKVCVDGRSNCGEGAPRNRRPILSPNRTTFGSSPCRVPPFPSHVARCEMPSASLGRKVLTGQSGSLQETMESLSSIIVATRRVLACRRKPQGWTLYGGWRKPHEMEDSHGVWQRRPCQGWEPQGCCCLGWCRGGKCSSSLRRGDTMGWHRVGWTERFARCDGPTQVG
jgi:hypothetical protein